jgi:hypothetical protein
MNGTDVSPLTQLEAKQERFTAEENLNKTRRDQNPKTRTAATTM